MGKGLKALVLGALLVTPLVTNATLSDRGGGMIYDTVLKVTWLQDMNYAQTSGYDADGRMTWPNARAWADNLVYGGFDDWRLPKIVDVLTRGCNFSYSGTDCGYNVLTASGGIVYSEMAHVWYVTLGNLAAFDKNGNQRIPHTPFANKGPFTNAKADIYWSGTERLPGNTGDDVWFFVMSNGQQHLSGPDLPVYAWALRSGDVIPVQTPEPSIFWMLLSGLAGFGYLGRRRTGA